MPNEKGEMEPGEHYTVPHPDGIAAKVDAARAYWRRMKETFGKPYNKVPGRAGEAVYDANPDYEARQKQEYTYRLTDYFDPEISKLNKEAADAREKAGKLPAESTRPKAEAADYPEQTKVAPPKTSKVEVPEVNTREIRERKLDQWTHGESQLSKFQVRSLVGGGLGAMVGLLLDHGTGATVGGIAGSVFGPAAIGKLVEMPAVQEWLTRPPAGELETLQKLPYADRIALTDGLKKVAAKAQAQGVKIDPRVAALVGAGTAAVVGPRTKELQSMRQSQ